MLIHLLYYLVWLLQMFDDTLESVWEKIFDRGRTTVLLSFYKYNPDSIIE